MPIFGWEMRRSVAVLLGLWAGSVFATDSPSGLFDLSYGVSSSASIQVVARASAPRPARLEDLLFTPEVAMPVPVHAPELVVSTPARYENLWDRIRDGFAIPEVESPLVDRWQAWYLARPQMLNGILERSRRYLFYVVEEISKRGMPMELALLPMVESGYNPAALSSAQAAGLWQFIPSTARKYSLHNTPDYDARRDIVASTGAALDYLQSLYELFGDWHLALASYNWGEKSVAQAIARNAAKGLPTDYLSLSLPQETRDYVPKLLALKNLIGYPSAFHLELQPIANQPYFTAIAIARSLDLTFAARLANVSLEELSSLNPGFARAAASNNATGALMLPSEHAEAFLANWNIYHARNRKTKTLKRGRTSMP